MDIKTVWLIFGFIGQTFFFSRFLVQWLASEQHKKSIMPNAFWYLSIFGGTVLFCYAIYRRDTVFVLGQFLGLVVYLRNLYFLKQDARQKPSWHHTA